jgi:hypothetical protein
LNFFEILPIESCQGLLKVKNSSSVFFIPSANSENMRKVFKHTWRIHGNYLIAHKEENKFRVVYVTQNHLGINT